MIPRAILSSILKIMDGGLPFFQDTSNDQDSCNDPDSQDEEVPDIITDVSDDEIIDAQVRENLERIKANLMMSQKQKPKVCHVEQTILC